MEHEIAPKVNWYLITIDDPELLPGMSFIRLLQLLLTVIPFKFVILNDIEGSGEHGLVYSLKQRQDEPILLSDLIPLLNGVIQLDWADFFLFKEYPSHWNNPDFYYPFLIDQSDTTVRAIDDQYIYIYTPHESIVNAIKAHYEIESLTLDALEKLSFPY